MQAFTIDVIAPEKGSVTVEDGRWVANVKTLSHAEEYMNTQGKRVRDVRERTYTTIGPKPRKQYLISGRRTSNLFDIGSKIVFEGEVLLIGDEPFGVVTEVEKEGVRELRGKLFTCSRQIQNGRIGEKPPVATPLLAWEAPNQDQTLLLGNRLFRRHVHRKRGKQQWASFEDTTRIMEMEPVDALLRYFPFSRINNPELQVFYAARCEKIDGRVVISGSWEWVRECDLLYPVSRELSTVWIPPGFAMTMLYLRHFGYVPHMSGDTTDKDQKAFKE